MDHAGCGAPDHFAFDLEEPHGERIVAVAGIARSANRQRSSWKFSRSARSRSETSKTRSTSAGLATTWGRDGVLATIGMMSDPDHHGDDGVDPAFRRDMGRVERDLLVGLPQGRGRRVLARVDAATGEAHLAPVRPQLGRTPGEDQPSFAFLLEQDGQDRRVGDPTGRA